MVGITSHDLARAVGLYLESISATNIVVDALENMAQDHQGGVQKRKSIKARTARVWLKKLGFNWRDVKKGVYTDGHEREDVIDYRQNVFLPCLSALQPSIIEWDAELNRIPKDLPEGEKWKILVTHDESTFNANDGRHQMWIEGDKQPLRPKGKGKGIMVSDFLTPIGRLASTMENLDDQPPPQQVLSIHDYLIILTQCYEVRNRVFRIWERELLDRGKAFKTNN